MHGAFALAGRKKKSGVIRDSKGKSRGEPEVIAAEVLAVRRRELMLDGIRPSYTDRESQKVHDNVRDALAGFTLGRLLLKWRQSPGCPDSVTQAQFDAGEAWTAIVHRHAAVLGYSLGRPSPGFIMVSTGVSCASDPEETEVTTIRRKYSDCYNALMDVGRESHEGTGIALITYAVCIEDRSLRTMAGREFGNLRVGLNALSRVLTRRPNRY